MPLSIKDRNVRDKFSSYPEHIREKLLFLRKLVLDTADEIEGIDEVEETLKWGEPSYVTKSGSTVRMDWKEVTPDQYAMYFHCLTSLVPTFRQLYGDTLRFEGDRAIVFHEDDDIPVEALTHCIELSLLYHKVKHLPMLGA